MAGVAPKFSPLDVLRALLLCSSEPLSRADFVKGLAIGEGSIRSILDTLKVKGLIHSTRQGHALSKEGVALKEQVLERLQGPASVECHVFSNQFNMGVLVRGVNAPIDAVRLRDTALKWGAEAALVFVMDKGKLHAPGVTEEVCIDGILKKFKPNNGDVVAVVAADSIVSAQTAALAVAVRADPELKKILVEQFAGSNAGVPLP